jgi:predicted transposase/invertase (TIGR01784 family)
MSIIYRSHDKFAKAGLKQKAIMVDFLQAHLSPDLYQRLDISTLHAIDKSFITPELRALHGDIVYRCQIEHQEGYIPIILLVEHQSKADEHMAFRLLQYTVSLMDDHLKAGYKRLPLVLPLCLYHGATSPYPYSTDIYDDFEVTDLARQWIFKPFQLIDLTQIPIETLVKHRLASILEVLLKSYQDPQLIQILQHLAEQGLFRLTMHHTDDTFLVNVLNYVTACGSDDMNQSANQLVEVLSAALPDKRDTIMTFAQQLRNEGMQQGMQQGIYQTNRENAKHMILEGLSSEKIARITGLSQKEIDALR